MKKVNCKTFDIAQLNDQIYRVRIEPIEGDLFDFRGGQYLILNMPDGKSVPLSIASAPEEKSFIELHLRLVAGHSLAEEMVQLFKTADSFSIEGAFGDCYLNESDRKLVIIAGGTGFSPMKSLIESAFIQKTSRDIALYLGAQMVSDLYQNELIEQWQVNNKQFEYTPVISGNDQQWSGETGFPHEPAIKDHLESLDANDYYISGSEPMVMAVYQALLDNGVNKNNIFSDMLSIKRERGEIE